MATIRRMDLEQEKQRRRRFDAEFKHEAARLVLEGGRTLLEVARNLGVNPFQAKDWVKKYKTHGKDAFPGNGALRPQDEDNRLLKKGSARVTEERDILKSLGRLLQGTKMKYGFMNESRERFWDRDDVPGVYRWPRTAWTRNSRLRNLMRPGSPISPTFPRGKGGSTSAC